MKAIALDGASRSSAMLLRLLCKERGLTPRFREVPHDEVLDAASGTTGALVIGDAGLRRRRALRARARSRRRLARADRACRSSTRCWPAAPAPSAPDDVAAPAGEPGAGPRRARPMIARAWSEAHGGDPADYERYLQRDIRYQLGRRGAVRPVGVLRSRPAPPSCSPRPVRPRLFESRAAHRAARRPARRRARSTPCSPTPPPASACRPTTRFACTPSAPALELGAAADARRQALHPDGEVTYIIDRNVNYTNVCVTRCKFCNFYRPPDQQDRGLRAVARGARPEVPGDGRPGRRADPAAGRPQPEAADRLVRGSVPLDEGELPARHPRPVARGDPLHRRDREHVDPRR